MKIFRDFKLHWWQFSIMKLTLIAFGIVIGSFWTDFFSQYTGWFLGLFIIGVIYLTSVWIKKQHGK